MTREEAEAVVLERMWGEMLPGVRQSMAEDGYLDEYEAWYLSSFEGQARIVSTLTRAIIDESGAPRAIARLAMWLGGWRP